MNMGPPVMPFTIQAEDGKVIVELKGGVTARHVAELAKDVASALAGAPPVVIRAGEVEDIDTSVLQMLVAVRKNAAEFLIEAPSMAFLEAVERCALRRELIARAEGE